MEEISFDGKMKIFIWQPSIEHLHYFTWQALQSSADLPVNFIVGALENRIRKAQNWKMMDLSELNPTLLPRQNLRKGGIKIIDDNPDAIHVFWGFRGGEGYNYFPLIFHALRKGAKVAVIDEAYTISPVGYYRDENIILSYGKVLIRPCLRYGMVKVLYAVSSKSKPCIIALSVIAKKQFLELGAAPETLFPFGYFVPGQKVISADKKKSAALRLIFVGALIFRKGLDILMEAVKILHAQGYSIELDIYGAGDEGKIKRDGLPIHYKNVLPYDQIQNAISEHDILVLPSRHDGWGAVVNEALLQGVPVIASSQVGAIQLLSSGAGLIFESENVGDLVEKIKMVIHHPAVLEEMRTKALTVGNEISPAKAAQYFLSVLRYYFYKVGPCPSAVWSEG